MYAALSSRSSISFGVNGRRQRETTQIQLRSGGCFPARRQLFPGARLNGQSARSVSRATVASEGGMAEARQTTEMVRDKSGGRAEIRIGQASFV